MALSNVVGSAEPFHCTTAPEANPVPFAVKMNAGPPAGAALGLIEPRVRPTVKLDGFEVRPPDWTLTETVVAWAIRFAGTAAVSSVELTNVVVSAIAFHSTTAPEANPVPFTVKVNAGPPAVVALGLIEKSAGPAATVSVSALEVTPPDFTVI